VERGAKRVVYGERKRERDDPLHALEPEKGSMKAIS
jgi:hypothetical protein